MAKSPVQKSSRKKTVRIGMYGIAKVLRMIHDNGHGADFETAMQGKDKSIGLDRKTYEAMRTFVASKPGLQSYAAAKDMMGCNPQYEICWDSATHPDFK
jgi:hypothetical protein